VVYLLALVIFVALSAACWFVSVACDRGTFAGSDRAAAPDDNTTAAAIGVASLTSFAPFPFGYPTGLVVWAAPVFGGLGLRAGRAAGLFVFPAGRARRDGRARELTGRRSKQPPHRRDARWRSPSSSTSCT